MAMLSMEDDKKFGHLGETLAADFLSQKGYEILARNLTFKAGEIDILAGDGETIVIVEVKNQRHKGSIDPIYRINQFKQQKLRLLARHVETKYPESNIRIDAITLYWEASCPLPQIQHYINILE